MFGHGAFSELSFSETKDTEAVFVGSLPIIYFNSSTLTFPLNINKDADFPLQLNTLQDYVLKINTAIDLTTRRQKMAQFCVNIVDGDVARVVTAMCANY